MRDQLAQPRVVERQPEFPLWLPARTRRREGRQELLWQVARALGDVLALTAAGTLTGAARTSALGVAWLGAIAALAVVVLAALGTYKPRRRLRLDDELRRVIGGMGFACIAVGAAAAVSGRSGVSDAVAVSWLVAAPLAVAGRASLFLTWRKALDGAQATGRALIVGAGRVGRLTAKRLLEDRQLALTPVGFLDKEPLAEGELPVAGPRDVPLPVFGASWDLEHVVEAQSIDTVVIAFSTAPHHVLVSLVRRAWKLGVDVLVVPRLYEVEGRRVRMEHLGGLPLVTLDTSDPASGKIAVKYAIDRVIAGLALLALAPVLAVVALAVRCALGRPILFRQQRVGRDGRVFEMLKFRTMHGVPNQDGEADAEWAELILAGSDGSPAASTPPERCERRSAVGDLLRKLSLDELPQLWNILRGDMSLIGPRPERVGYVAQFEDVVYRYGDRHRVKSGLTGWAQVHGLRGETSLADRVEWDNFYIENWSFWLDLKIIVMTVPALFGRRGGR
jgi:exopolysaccharide biosynthesis polyprenyl glycosylphosphotransferase